MSERQMRVHEFNNCSRFRVRATKVAVQRINTLHFNLMRGVRQHFGHRRRHIDGQDNLQARHAQLQGLTIRLAFNSRNYNPFFSMTRLILTINKNRNKGVFHIQNILFLEKTILFLEFLNFVI